MMIESKHECPWVTTADAAGLLNLARTQVHYLIISGQLPAHRMQRGLQSFLIHTSDIDAYVTGEL